MSRITFSAAGQAARAFQIGRTIFFAVIPIARALFPKVVSKGTTTHSEWRLLRRGWAYASLIVGLAVGGGCLLPQFPLWLLFGERNASPEMLRLVRFAVSAMAPVALLAVPLNFELAQHRFTVTAPLVAAAAVYVLVVWFAHDAVLDVAVVLGLTSLAALAATIAMQAGRAVRREPRTDGERMQET